MRPYFLNEKLFLNVMRFAPFYFFNEKIAPSTRPYFLMRIVFYDEIAPSAFFNAKNCLLRRAPILLVRNCS